MTDAAALRPWRCFVAVPLPAHLRTALSEWVSSIRHDAALDADWRWTDPDGWHVTLAFLGATPEAAVPGIAERLTADLTGHSGFTVAAGGIGGFPSHGRARVLWYGIRDEGRLLADLARRVRGATGVDEASPFRAHVTLARSRDHHGLPLPALPVDVLPAADVPVSGVDLMRSHLGRGPAHYEILASIPLLTPVAAGASS